MNEEGTDKKEDQTQGEAPEAVEEDPATLRAKLEEEQKKAQGYLANWQRSQADFVNYRRRAEQEKEEVAKFASSVLMAGLLPVVDDFERALDSLSPQLMGLSWVDGIRLIHRRLLAVMEAQGLKEIEADGQEFDPNFHQAVTFAEGEDGKVVEVLQKGYMLHDRVLRPSMVAVGKAAEDKKEAAEDKAEQVEGAASVEGDAGEPPHEDEAKEDANA